MRDSITQDITNIATRNGQSLKTTTVNSASKKAIYRTHAVIYGGSHWKIIIILLVQPHSRNNRKGLCFESGENFTKTNTPSSDLTLSGGCRFNRHNIK